MVGQAGRAVGHRGRHRVRRLEDGDRQPRRGRGPSALGCRPGPAHLPDGSGHGSCSQRRDQPAGALPAVVRLAFTSKALAVCRRNGVAAVPDFVALAGSSMAAWSTNVPGTGDDEAGISSICAMTANALMAATAGRGGLDCLGGRQDRPVPAGTDDGPPRWGRLAMALMADAAGSWRRAAPSWAPATPRRRSCRPWQLDEGLPFSLATSNDATDRGNTHRCELIAFEELAFSPPENPALRYPELSTGL